MTALRALLVEDHEPDARLLLRELARGGFEVTAERVWREAEFVAALAAEWDVVLCDYQLPGFSVDVVLATIRARRLDLPVIVLSGAVGEETAVRTMRTGARDFIAKGAWPRLAPAIAREVAEARERRARRALEGRLDQAAKEEVLGRLAGGVAHDVNNLLTAISGNADLAARRAASGRPADEQLRRIEEAVRLGAALTRRLLTYVRREDPSPKPTDLAAVVASAAELLPVLLGRGIRLDVRLEAELPAVLIDADRATQAVMNLAVNARDAMPGGGVLTIATERRGDEVALVVGDTGPGIPPEVRARLFEPFFTTKPAGQGTGLGLAMCQTFARDAGGRIEVTSDAGQGTRFALILPRVAAPPAAAPAPAGRTRIAIVADADRAVRELVCAAVAGVAGLTAWPASDGEAAAVFALDHLARVALVVVDAATPRLDGREVVRRIHAARPDVPVIVMGSAATDVDGDHLKFLPKPFIARDLVDRLAALGLAPAVET